jgi:hypothetical protein
MDWALGLIALAGRVQGLYHLKALREPQVSLVHWGVRKRLFYCLKGFFGKFVCTDSKVTEKAFIGRP